MSEDRSLMPAKKIPTRVKHWILGRCLTAWGGIIVRNNPRDSFTLAFVDTCCGSGLYRTKDNDDGEYESGSAIIGPHELQKAVSYGRKLGRTVSGSALLINEDADELRTAEKAINAAGISAGITIEYMDKKLVDVMNVVQKTMTDALTFAFIDPYGPQPTPFSAVSRIVATPRTDALINFPFYSLQKWTGFFDRDAASLAPDERARLVAADAFMDGPEWRDVVARARRTGERLDDALLTFYMEKLGRFGVYTLGIPLRFEKRKDTNYALVFTSRKVSGLASAKKQFVDGLTKEFQLRQDAQVEETGQAFLPGQDTFEKPKIDENKLGRRLMSRFSGRTVTLEDVVLEGIQWSTTVDSDVMTALGALKRSGAAAYEPARLKYKDRIKFKKPSTDPR